MKSALILGLALTASAFSADQFDNELIVAPTDQFGNIKKYPGNIRFDEEADDELRVIRPGYLQVADDELRVAPTDEFGRIKPYPPGIRFDEEGNDLFSLKAPRYSNLTNRFPGIFLDDELMRGPYQRRRRSADKAERKVDIDEADNEYTARGKAAAAKKYRPGLVEHVKQHPETVFFDQDDDELVMSSLEGAGLFRRRFDDVERRKFYDELLVKPISIQSVQAVDDELIKPPKKQKGNGNGNVVMNDDEADDELHSDLKMSAKLFVEKRAEALRRDDGVDDELLIRPVVPFVAADDELLSIMSPRLFVERSAEALRLDDEVDDELLKIFSGLLIERGAEALRLDDEVDDELSWLDDLLKDAPYNGAIFRSLDDNDDEFRAEKPAHGFLPFN